MKKPIGMMGLALVAILAVQSSYGSTRTWLGNGSGLTTAQKKQMSQNANWVGVTPGSGDIMRFNGSSAQGFPNMNQNILIEQILSVSTLTKQMKWSGASANTLRIRNTAGNGIDVAGANNQWINISGTMRQDNAVFGGGTSNEVSWITRGTGQLILSPGKLTLEQDMQMDVQDAGGVIDIRTSMEGNTTTAKSWDVRKTGAGTLLYNAAMVINGATIVEGGTLQLGVDQAVNSASAMTFSDGTKLVSGGFDGDFNTLDIDGTVVFDLLDSALMSFDNSSGAWDGTATLDLQNYTLGSLQFGSDASGLTTAQQDTITVDGAGAGTYYLDAGGYVIPEPATISLVIFSGFGIVFFRRFMT